MVFGLALQPLFAALHAQLLTAPVLRADETPVASSIPAAGKTKHAYLFEYRNTDSHPIVLFDYEPTLPASMSPPSSVTGRTT